MGSFDFAQIADLVAIYILDTQCCFLDLWNIGLYRSDRLISIPNSNGPLTLKIQKKVIRAFEYMGLRIEIISNLKIVDFLDVTFNLSNNSCKLDIIDFYPSITK